MIELKETMDRKRKVDEKKGARSKIEIKFDDGCRIKTNSGKKEENRRKRLIKELEEVRSRSNSTTRDKI